MLQGWCIRIVAAIIAVAMLAWVAWAEDLPDQRPILRLDPGMHTAPIRGLSVNAACNLIATGSEDKTVRLWALPQGRGGNPELLRTLRLPIGEGHQGNVYSVALSPDGKYVAAGGWDARYSIDKTVAVYIFEAASGRLVTRLGRLNDVVEHLTFSPDGSRLAATLGGGEGMRLWETAGWQLIGEDKVYGGKHSLGEAFDGTNHLYAVGYDGQIRRYSENGGLEAVSSSQAGKEPSSIAVHPDGGKLAIGFNDTTAVEVYDASTLKPLFKADTGGIEGGNLGNVAWSRDGTRLYAGGRFESKGAPIVIWQGQGRGKRNIVPLSQSTITGVLPCGTGIAVAAADPAFGLISPDGVKRAWQESVTVNMRDKKREAFTLSADALRTRFGLGRGGERPVLFDLAAFRLTEAPRPMAGLAEPKITGLAIIGWENKFTPRLNGNVIPLKPYERSRALAIAPGGALFALGTNYSLRAYRANGEDLWRKRSPATTYGVNIGRDVGLIVAAYDDGTIRWHRLSDGTELLALFIHAKDRRFIAWTPEGYYAASSGAEELIGWQVNRDWDHAADWFPASRFRDDFNRPDIVKRVLAALDEDKAISEANRLANARPAENIAINLPPVITILSPTDGSTFTSDSLTVHYRYARLRVSRLRSSRAGRRPSPPGGTLEASFRSAHRWTPKKA